MKILEDIKLILLFQLIYQLQNARSSFEDSASEVEESQELKESTASSEEQRHSHKHRHVHRAGHRRKKSRSSHSHDHDLDNDHEHDHDHDHAHLRARSNEDNDDCECACNKCDSPSDCCKSACKTCPSGNPYQQPSRGMTGQSSVVFVPYPYPMMMPSPIVTPAPNRQETMRARELTQEPATTSTTTSTTTTTTTTFTTTTTTENPADIVNSQHNSNILEAVLKSVVDDYSNIIAKTPEKLPNGNNKYMLTSLRRTKPAWMPKFGIVPISDNIAEKIISKMSRTRVPHRTQKERVSMYDKSNLRNVVKKY